jgi:predicted ATPase/class 3 adenylate cyclase
MPAAPSGTVSFLFSDIEGSTQLLGALGPDRYADVHADHHRLLRQMWERHSGYEVDSEGDAFFVAFGRASEAIKAAADAQRALAEHEWPDGRDVRVRIGVHSGEAIAIDGKYVGVAVHRGARICSAASGGQVLISHTTRALVGDEAIEGLGFLDIGEHRLKDLTLGQRLYQLTGDGLMHDFPPPRTLENRPTNLPIQPTPFLGRARELGEIGELLRGPDVRLVTLTGPGGSGKTRLALQVAAEVVDHFKHGVFLVTLAPVSDPELVLSTITQTLGLREQPGQTLQESLASGLRERELLLLLDNFEQVEPAAPTLGALLGAVPKLRLLVTSRAPLHLAAEREYPVSPLEEQQAVELFTERARAVDPAFTLDGDRPVVAEICRRLDLLPLAVELAAARVKFLPPAALLRRLDERLKLLTGGARDHDERQRTLRGAIDWSYNLLTDEERVLFRRLSVFAGGWTLESAETVCARDGALEVIDVLASLLDKSLIRQTEARGEPRFSMLATIREYAHECLQTADDADKLHREHAQHFAAVAEEARTAWRDTPELEQEWLERLETEHDNMRAALEYAREQSEPDLELRLATPLGFFWDRRGYVAEGRRWLEDALDRSADVDPSLRARALNRLAMLAYTQRDLVCARDAAEEGLAVARDLGNARQIAAALEGLSLILRFGGDLKGAAACSDEALAIVGRVSEGEPDIALRELEAGIVLNRGDLALYEGDFARARLLFEQAKGIFEDTHDAVGVGYSLGNIGVTAIHVGDDEEAVTCLARGLETCRAHNWNEGIAYCLEALAAVAANRKPGVAARLLGAAASIRSELETTLEPVEQRMHLKTEASVLALLGDGPFEREFSIGGAMHPQEASAYALGEIASNL